MEGVAAGLGEAESHRQGTLLPSHIQTGTALAAGAPPLWQADRGLCNLSRLLFPLDQVRLLPSFMEREQPEQPLPELPRGTQPAPASEQQILPHCRPRELCWQSWHPGHGTKPRWEAAGPWPGKEIVGSWVLPEGATGG